MKVIILFSFFGEKEKEKRERREYDKFGDWEFESLS